MRSDTGHLPSRMDIKSATWLWLWPFGGDLSSSSPDKPVRRHLVICIILIAALRPRPSAHSFDFLLGRWPVDSPVFSLPSPAEPGDGLQLLVGVRNRLNCQAWMRRPLLVQACCEKVSCVSCLRGFCWLLPRTRKQVAAASGIMMRPSARPPKRCTHSGGWADPWIVRPRPGWLSETQHALSMGQTVRVLPVAPSESQTLTCLRSRGQPATSGQTMDSVKEQRLGRIPAKGGGVV